MAENCEDNSRKIVGPITVPQPLFDPYFSGNEKIIDDLLIDETRYHSTPGYCIQLPPETVKWMRRALLSWLRDVSVYHKTDVDVLAQTAQLVDRYLHVVPTTREEYQLVGSTCFLIASKLKETVSVTVRDMVLYSDYSITQDDIIAKELTVCLALKWDLTCITPVDFIAPIVEFLDFVPTLRQIIRQSALNIYMKTFHIEDLSMYLPSYTAAACILYALNLTVHPDLCDAAMRSVTRIQQLLKLEARKIREVYQHLQSCFEPNTVELTEAIRRFDRNCPETSPEPTTTSSQTIAEQPTSSVLSFTSNTQSQANGSSLSHSISSAGSSGGSFDPPSRPVSTSLSTSSPLSEIDIAYLNELENEPPSDHILKSQLRGSQVCHPQHRETHHPNFYAAGQNMVGTILPHTVDWESALVEIMEETWSKSVELSALSAGIVLPCVPNRLVPAGPPQDSHYRWTPTDIRDVHLD